MFSGLIDSLVLMLAATGAIVALGMTVAAAIALAIDTQRVLPEADLSDDPIAFDPHWTARKPTCSYEDREK